MFMCVAISSTDHWRLNWSWHLRWRRLMSGSFRRRFPVESTHRGRPRRGDATVEAVGAAAAGAADDDDEGVVAVVVRAAMKTTTPTLSEGRHLWSKTFRQPLLRLRPLRLRRHCRRHLAVALCCGAISLWRSGTKPIVCAPFTNQIFFFFQNKRTTTITEKNLLRIHSFTDNNQIFTDVRIFQFILRDFYMIELVEFEIFQIIFSHT